ncbi:MAG: amidohydrolase family protein [Oscillospiraceae bacterium]|nr:amidohydrolase family protein [Oscillospiraceae bacterium]
MERFAWKGNIYHTNEERKIEIFENSWVLCEDGICKGVVKELPEEWKNVEITDFGDKIIIPGLCDLHVHAPQYTYRGTGMDLELLDWLEKYAFPEEASYSDLEYAEKAYSVFVRDLRRSATTRASIFASLHVPATEILMEKLEESGLKTFVGKVNMDRNSPDILRESTKDSAEKTESWISESLDKFKNTKPIITPRFTPTCTDELMEKLGEIQKKYGTPVQSHLSENPSEIKWVSELCPDTDFYGEAYDKFGLFGGENRRCIMAHCVYSGEKEQALIKERGVWIAHCPQSNMNVASGIAPVRQFLDNGLKVGLGSDVAGGSSLSIFRAMTDAVMCSKLRWRLVDSSLHQLSIEDAFYMATRGGGSFFGKVGAFGEGFEMDAVVIDDSALYTPKKLSSHDRFEKLCYLYTDAKIVAKCVSGKMINLD